jgi:hypothetical protein
LPLLSPWPATLLPPWPDTHAPSGMHVPMLQQQLRHRHPPDTVSFPPPQSQPAHLSRPFLHCAALRCAALPGDAGHGPAVALCRARGHSDGRIRCRAAASTLAGQDRQRRCAFVRLCVAGSAAVACGRRAPALAAPAGPSVCLARLHSMHTASPAADTSDRSVPHLSLVSSPRHHHH